MSIARLVFTPPKKKMIGSIAIDVFEKETYTRESAMTSFPIEDGSEISEHTINLPQELTIQGFVGASNLAATSNLTSNFISVFDQINTLMDSKQLVTIVMGLQVYDNMHIESFEVERDKATGQGLPFTMKLKEAVWVNSQSTDIPSGKIGAYGPAGNNKKQVQANKNIGTANNGQSQTENEIVAAYKKGNAVAKIAF